MQRLDRAQVGERRVDRDVDCLVVVLGRSRTASFCTTWMASRWLWCIFQLPLMSGFRAAGFSTRGIRCLSQGGETGKVALVLDELEDAPPPVDTWSTSVVEAELGHGSGAVAATDDRERRAPRRRLRRRSACRREAWVLEDAHRPVPEDRACRRRCTSENSAAVPGPMSRPFEAGRNVACRPDARRHSVPAR